MATLTLNKHQQREVSTTLARLPILGTDYGARCLSALYRSALRDSQKREILSIAAAYGLASSPEFII
jgi:hypothetical protein